MIGLPTKVAFRMSPPLRARLHRDLADQAFTASRTASVSSASPPGFIMT